mmetsp:Transcript_16178/g.25884  ORF Transcript_16178/g.25884 Transcript_16178/m.25884 type:complete len:113 (+) Transcript_16178:202-540(+)
MRCCVQDFIQPPRYISGNGDDVKCKYSSVSSHAEKEERCERSARIQKYRAIVWGEMLLMNRYSHAPQYFWQQMINILLTPFWKGQAMSVKYPDIYFRIFVVLLPKRAIAERP